MQVHFYKHSDPERKKEDALSFTRGYEAYLYLKLSNKSHAGFLWQCDLLNFINFCYKITKMLWVFCWL